MSSMDAVIFDMDGVLIDSEVQWQRVEGEFFRRHIPGWTRADHDRIVGLGVPDLYRFLVQEHRLDLSFEAFARECENLAAHVYGEAVTLYPGFEELFDAVREEKIPVGLATSSPRRWVDRVLTRFRLSERFDSITTIDDVDGEGKPSPAIYRHAARSLEIQATRAVAIEDSVYGVRSAKAAGLKVLALRNGSNGSQDLSRADDEAEGFLGVTVERLRSLLR